MPAAYDRTSQNLIYCSRAGIPRIANLALPQAGPDASAALQALCNLNAPGGPLAGLGLEIVIDLPILHNQTLLYPNTIITGMGGMQQDATHPPAAGSWMKQIPASGPGSTNQFLFTNADWSSPSSYQGSNGGTVGNVLDYNIKIRELAINGQGVVDNGGVFVTGTTNANISGGGIVACIAFFGVQNPIIDEVYIYDPTCYGIWQSNVFRGKYNRNSIVVPSILTTPTTAKPGTAGIQFNGPAAGCEVRDTTVATGDDGIALNAIDGSGDTMNRGPISNFLVDGINCINCQNMVRLMVGSSGAGTSSMDDITIRNARGTATNLVIAYTYPGSSGGVKSGIKFSDWKVRPTVGTYPYTTIGGILLGGTWVDLVIENVDQLNFTSGQTTGMIACNIYGETTSDFTCQSLTIKDWTIVEGAGEITPMAAPLTIVTGANINTLKLEGFTWLRTSGTAVPAVLISGGTVANLILDGPNIDNVQNLVQVTGGTVNSITSSDLTHTNASGNASFDLSVAVGQFTASGSNTAALLSGTAPTSKQTDGTQRS